VPAVHRDEVAAGRHTHRNPARRSHVDPDKVAAWIASQHIPNPDEVDPGAAAHHDLLPDPATEKRLAEGACRRHLPFTLNSCIIGYDHELHLAVPIQDSHT
jgi:hypothetical protein